MPQRREKNIPVYGMVELSTIRSPHADQSLLPPCFLSHELTAARTSHKYETGEADRNLTHLPAAQLKHLDRSACSAGVSNLAGRLGVTNHDGQTDRGEPAGQGYVPLDVEAELAVVSVVGLRCRLQVDRLVLRVGLLRLVVVSGLMNDGMKFMEENRPAGP